MRCGHGPLFLVGFMGCGKSSIGARVAEMLHRSFEDSDRELERREGRAIGAIIAESGEPHFRELESALLLELGDGQAVVATGGGAFLRAATRRALFRRGCTVWIDAPFEICRERIGAGEGRPLWPAGDRLAQRALYERRRACYALADLRIDAEVTPERVAAGLATLVERGNS